MANTLQSSSSARYPSHPMWETPPTTLHSPWCTSAILQQNSNCPMARNVIQIGQVRSTWNVTISHIISPMWNKQRGKIILTKFQSVDTSKKGLSIQGNPPKPWGAKYVKKYPFGALASVPTWRHSRDNITIWPCIFQGWKSFQRKHLQVLALTYFKAGIQTNSELSNSYGYVSKKWPPRIYSVCGCLLGGNLETHPNFNINMYIYICTRTVYSMHKYLCIYIYIMIYIISKSCPVQCGQIVQNIHLHQYEMSGQEWSRWPL